VREVLGVIGYPGWYHANSEVNIWVLGYFASCGPRWVCRYGRWCRRLFLRFLLLFNPLSTTERTRITARCQPLINAELVKDVFALIELPTLIILLKIAKANQTAIPNSEVKVCWCTLTAQNEITTGPFNIFLICHRRFCLAKQRRY
jgi:hypothetical protein